MKIVLQMLESLLMAHRVWETQYIDGKRRREMTKVLWPKELLTPLLLSKDWETVDVQFSQCHSDLDSFVGAAI